MGFWIMTSSFGLTHVFLRANRLWMARKDEGTLPHSAWSLKSGRAFPRSKRARKETP